MIVLRSTKAKLDRTHEKLKPKTVLRVITSLLGVMILFGLTWLFAAFTFTIEGSDITRYIFQALFVVCASLQGFFIFMFFCVLDQKSRNAWKSVFLQTRKDVYSMHNLNSFRLSFTRMRKGTGPSSPVVQVSKSSSLKFPDSSNDSKCNNYTVTEV